MHKKQIITILILIILSAILHFKSLGYAEFQDDEKKAIIGLKKGMTTRDFLLNQRKGPMQFFVTQATIQAGVDKRNELGIRVPFAVLSVFSVVVFYFILSQYFQAESVKFLGGLLFVTNGFFVGFGRIAQYQNINIFFSLSALLMFILVTKRTVHVYMYALLGTLFFAISLLAHWDAIFFVFPISILFCQFLAKKEICLKTKVLTTLGCLGLGSALLLPFLIPYWNAQITNSDNIRYFDKRVGSSNYPLQRHMFIFELYNPYITYYLLLGLTAFSVINFKKSWMFWIWFIFNFLTIKYLMQKPGTHIYNYVLPAISLSTFGINIFTKNTKVFKFAFASLVFILSLLYFQSYKIFVEHKQEYPWDEKVIFKMGDREYKTVEYTDAEVLAFGFPRYRNWKGINEFVNNDPDNCTYISNEGKEISEIYMKASHGIKENRKCYYVVVVKRPFITGARNAEYPEASGKEPVFVYTNPNSDEKLVEVYKKRQRQKDND